MSRNTRKATVKIRRNSQFRILPNPKIEMFQVLGKLAFATVAGYFIDSLGLMVMYSVFTLLAAFTLPILYFMPDKQIVKSQ